MSNQTACSPELLFWSQRPAVGPAPRRWRTGAGCALSLCRGVVTDCRCRVPTATRGLGSSGPTARAPSATRIIAQCFHRLSLFLVLGMKRNVVLWSLAAGCADSLSGSKGGDSLGGHARSCPSCAGWSGRSPAPSSLLLQGHASDFRLLLLLPPPHAP